MDIIDQIIGQIDYLLNKKDMFYNRKPNLKEDRFYKTSVYLSQIEALFLKNLLEEIKEEYWKSI